MSKTSSAQIYVILTGVSGNLGDAVIRRRVLEWSRGLGDLHAYVGRTTPGWVEQLGLRSDERVYGASGRRTWLKGLVFGRGRRVMVFDPGEVPLGREHLRSELMFLAIVAAVRIRGGVVFRPPRAVGRVDPFVGWLYRTSSRLSNVVLWRERPSFERMGVGRLVPDTAFAEPRLEGAPAHERTAVVVSMRGKRELPPSQWFDGITAFALAHNYKLVLLSQVDEDEERTRELAARFGPIAEYVPWGERSDLEQEVMVRDRYLTSAMAISDRLHVLILAAQAGAMPVEVAPAPKPKVEQHFSTIGMPGLSLDCGARTAAEVAAYLEAQLLRRDELSERMIEASENLDREIASLRALVTQSS